MDFAAALGQYLDPLALAGVVGGALLIAASRSGLSTVGNAFRALAPLVRADPVADANAAIRAVNAIERVAEARGIVRADRVESAQRYLRRAAIHLSDATSAGDFTRWADEDIADRRRRHGAVIDYWNSVAEAGPALGMVGTIVGLAGMFAAMSDADAIGPAMAVAILTTLYGIILANLVALPVARRLERLSDDELAWQRRALDHLAALARAEFEDTPQRRLRAVQ